MKRVGEQIKSEEDVPTSILLEVVSDLENHPHLKNSVRDEESSVDIDDTRKEEDKKREAEEEREYKRNVLLTFVTVLASQLESVNNKLALEKDKPVRSEDKIRDLEREITDLDNKISDLQGQIAALS